MSRLNHILQRMEGYASRPCLESNGCSHNYAELLEEVRRWERRLDELSIESGCVVGMQSDYSFSATSALFALFRRGAIAALVPRAQDPMPYLFDARATVLLSLDSDGNLKRQTVQNVQSHPLLERLRNTGEGGFVIFTSGSTGRPKATLQSLERFLYKFQTPGHSLRTLAFLLLDHIGGLDTLMYTLSSGGTLVLASRRDPESVLSIIESHRVEVLPASPSFLRLLCVSWVPHKYDLSSLKIVTYGAEPMDSNTLSRIKDLIPNARILQKYGTTETGSPRTVSRGDDSLWLKIKSDGVEIKIIDQVLWIRSEGGMLGYLNEQLEVDEQGWYCTGDLVDIDGEWIKFRGRVKDVISVGGEKVAPTEVERVLLELEFVSHALVSGEPHPLMGAIVTAKVGLTDTTLDPVEAVRRIRLHCRARLPLYKVPVKVQIVAERFENERQKTQRGLPSSHS